MDLMAYWARLANEVRAKQGKNAEVDTYHLVFKAKYFFEPDPNDHACVEMMFMQGCYDVVDGRYPCADQDAITLAALQVVGVGGWWLECVSVWLECVFGVCGCR